MALQIKRSTYSILFTILAGVFLPANFGLADNQEINFYGLSRTHWDIMPNETLGEIIDKILPSSASQNHKVKQQLIKHIIESNSHAFINSDPKRMLAYKRLWFTNAKPTHITAKKHTSVKRYAWGYIKESKNNK